MVEKGVWFVIIISWMFNLFYVGTMFLMMFYSVIDSIILIFK